MLLRSLTDRLQHLTTCYVELLSEQGSSVVFASHLMMRAKTYQNSNAFQCLANNRGGELVTVVVISMYGLKGVAGPDISKSSDVTSVLSSYYASQKKTFEINPRHPLIKDMLRRVKVNKQR